MASGLTTAFPPGGKLTAELLGQGLGFEATAGRDGAGAHRAMGAGSETLTLCELMVELGTVFSLAMPLDILSAICLFFSSVRRLL